MRVNFFDLGAFDGLESRLMLDILDELNIKDFKIYVFEPCKESFNSIKNLLPVHENVILVNSGISNFTGKGKLYHSFRGNEVGHSIFSSKNNVYENDYEEIDLVKFSEFILQNNVELQDSVNVLKFNIEGAEWHLINDLVETKILKDFNIFCGDGFDIYKISELNQYRTEYENMLKENDITIIPFSLQGYAFEMDRVINEKNILKNKIKLEYEKLQSISTKS